MGDMLISKKERKWFKPAFDDGEVSPPKQKHKLNALKENGDNLPAEQVQSVPKVKRYNDLNNKNWIRNFDPTTMEELAVHNKKIQEVEQWFTKVSNSHSSDVLLLSGPVGAGKTITVRMLADKYNMKLSEWIIPLDIEIPSDHGDYEYREKQSIKFRDFIIKAANFTSLLDNNANKLVLVEDYPNTFLRTPADFTEVLEHYKNKAKSPIVFICSDSYMDSKNSALTLFTNSLKERFNIHHITFNSVSPTGLRSALKRVSQIISRNYKSFYNPPMPDLIECVVNSSAGDLRSAILNLHFSCLKGSSQSLETSIMEGKGKRKKKKPASIKFLSLGKDQTVSIMHGVGRVLNPKRSEDCPEKFTHSPQEVVEQFMTQPNSFLGFLEENYLTHFSNIEHVEKAAMALSDADFLLAEWREKFCQEYSMYVAVSGLMVANKTPVSSWNPVRGPKNMRIQYPSAVDIRLLEENELPSGKTLILDYQTYCKIISNSSLSSK